jgi:hypothetical protein
MNMTSEIKKGAKIQVRLDLTPGGVRHIRIIADSVESRDAAMQHLQACLPQLELLEAALQQAFETIQ